MIEIDWKEQCRMRIRNSDPSFDKHEIVKLLILLLTKRKHKQPIGIYSEYPMPDGTIPDVTIDFPNSIVNYEIQNTISPAWLERIKQRDLDSPMVLLKKVDTIIIPLKDLSNDLNTLIVELEKYII